METAISGEHKKREITYLFERWEKTAIANGLLSEINKRYKKISKIQNSPKNEGQVIYLEQVRILRDEIGQLEDIITEFS